ncbi:hypothetical protein Q8309_001381 [Salmonella enterica]|nr:hypothetical protein [Salmonella enterica]
MDNFQSAPSAPASTGSENPYLNGSADAGQQSPYMSQGDVNPFGQQSATDPAYAQGQPLHGNNQFTAEQQAQLPQQQSEGAQVGDVLQTMDGTQVQYSQELHNSFGELHQAIEGQLGAGTVDRMLEFGQTLDQNTQSALERMLLSGDRDSMQRAIQFVQGKMHEAGAGYVPQQQGGWNTPQANGYQQPQGISRDEFHAGLSALERSGYSPGHRQYDEQYKQLVQQYSLGKRTGR